MVVSRRTDGVSMLTEDVGSRSGPTSGVSLILVESFSILLYTILVGQSDLSGRLFS